MIVADTSAVVALLDDTEQHHRALLTLYRQTASEWILPAVILAEVDYLLERNAEKKQRLFFSDVVAGVFFIEWGREEALALAHRISTRYRSLRLGLVDAMRLRAEAIATLDLRHFAAVSIVGNPRLLPRDL